MNPYRAFLLLLVLTETYFQGAQGSDVCPPGWIEGTQACYLTVSTEVEWLTAWNQCRKLGGHLAVIDESVGKLVEPNFKSSPSLWIGLVKKPDGSFSWVNGEQLTFTNWNQYEPSNSGGHEICVEMRNNLQWNDNSCNQKRGFVCQRAKDDHSTDCCVQARPCDVPRKDDRAILLSPCNDLYEGGQCEYICLGELKPLNIGKLTCGSDRKWSPPVAICQEPYCPLPSKDENATFKETCDHVPEGGECWYTCSDGPSTKKEGKMICGSNREWTPSSASCKANTLSCAPGCTVSTSGVCTCEKGSRLYLLGLQLNVGQEADSDETPTVKTKLIPWRFEDQVDIPIDVRKTSKNNINLMEEYISQPSR